MLSLIVIIETDCDYKGSHETGPEHRSRSPPPVGGGTKKWPPRFQRAGGAGAPPRFRPLGGQFPPIPGGELQKFVPPQALGGEIFGIWVFPPRNRGVPPQESAKSWGGTEKSWGGTHFGVIVPPQNPRSWGGSKWCPPISRDPGGGQVPPYSLGGNGTYGLIFQTFGFQSRSYRRLLLNYMDSQESLRTQDCRWNQ